MRYMGYVYRRGAPRPKEKPLVPELMRHFGIARRTALRALAGLKKPAPLVPGKSGPEPKPAPYRELLGRAHAASKPADVARPDVDVALRKALIAWMTQSTTKSQNSIAIAKLLLEALP
jgi:hypothetical protein